MHNRIFQHDAPVSTVARLDPSSIFAKMDACPPLMRDEAQDAYLGKEVAWLLHFADGAVRQQGEAYLIFQVDDGVRVVTGTVVLADYPWLKSLRTNETVRVRGRIRRVDAMKIELGAIRLDRPRPTVVPSNN